MRTYTAVVMPDEDGGYVVSIPAIPGCFCRVHESLTITDENGKRIKRTPAMAAGIARYPWSLTQLCGLLD